MKYKLLGTTGVRVSEICLGTMTFGHEADEAEAFRIMDTAFEAGVNFFDTADIYTRGKSEEIIGKWLKERAHEVIVASKVYFPASKEVNDRGSSRLHIVRGVEGILRRLQRECLEILYLHHWDEDTAIEESLSAMTDLRRQGKILYCAASNFSAWQTMKAIAAAETGGFAPIVLIQPQYNLLKRQAEVEILPLAKDQGLGVCPYSPIAAGLLSGKYQRKEKGRIDVNPNYTERYRNAEYWEVSDRFVAFAAEAGYQPAALAVAWVGSHPQVTAPIVGARDVGQLKIALSATEIPMDAELRAWVTGLSIEPPLATDREKTTFVPNAAMAKVK